MTVAAKGQVRCVARVESALGGGLHAAVLEGVGDVGEVLGSLFRL